MKTLTGRLLWRGQPVVGADITVGSYPLPQATHKQGNFSYNIDDTVAGRHAVHVTGLSRATIGGKPIDSAEKRSLSRASGGFSSAFAISKVKTSVQHNGDVLVTGTATDSSGAAPPTVHLVSYELTGRITNADGNPVVGAYVITRTQDRDYWTRSNPSNSNGYYTSFFTAADTTDANPVLISVGVAYGSTSYGGITGTNIDFARLKSSRLNIQLGTGTSYKISPPTSFGTAFYSGLMDLGWRLAKMSSNRFLRLGPAGTDNSRWCSLRRRGAAR